MTSLADRAFKTEKGVQPAADYISKKIQEYVRGRMLKQYGDFLEAKTAYETIEKTRELAEEHGLKIGKTSGKPFFVTDVDMGMNGATGNACALIKPGKKNAPLRIAIAHSDSPCLRLTPQPVYFELDALASNVCPSFSLNCEPYGGVRKQDWYGRPVLVTGKVFKKKWKTKT